VAVSLLELSEVNIVVLFSFREEGNRGGHVILWDNCRAGRIFTINRNKAGGICEGRPQGNESTLGGGHNRGSGLVKVRISHIFEAGLWAF